MYCNYCGKSIQDDANVCAYCGTRVGGVIARKRLLRPREGRKVAGVCLGLAEYFDIDVIIIRLVALIGSLATGIGFIGYLIAWIVIPDEPYLLPSQANVGQPVSTP
jgi:phage shock protein C